MHNSKFDTTRLAQYAADIDDLYDDENSRWGSKGSKEPYVSQTYQLGSRLGSTRPRWLVREFIRQNNVVVLFGESGSRKTWLSIDLALSIAKGKPFLERFDTKKSKVLYVISEGADDFEYRCIAWCKHHGISYDFNGVYDDDLLANFHYAPTKYDFSDDGGIDNCMSDVESVGGVDFIIIDTLSKNFGGDADKNADMTGFLNRIETLRDRSRATILVIHHTGWGNTNRERGGRSLRDGCDTSICVSRCKEGLSSTISCKKQKIGVEFAPIKVEFEFHELPEFYFEDDQEFASGLVAKSISQADGSIDVTESTKETIKQVLRNHQDGINQTRLVDDVKSLNADAPNRDDLIRLLCQMVKDCEICCSTGNQRNAKIYTMMTELSA